MVRKVILKGLFAFDVLTKREHGRYEKMVGQSEILGHCFQSNIKEWPKVLAEKLQIIY